jgi:hypothetical protein
MSSTPRDGETRTIAESHADNELALEMARAIRRAEVAFLGEDAKKHAKTLEPLLVRANARLVDAPTPTTRFVVPGDDVSDDELLAASDNGALLLRPEEVETLVTAYLAVWFPDGMQEATRRAREEARKLALVKATAVRKNADKWRSSLVGERASRMQTRVGNDGGSAADGGSGKGRLSQEELRIEGRAREARASDTRTSLRRLIG